MRVIIVAVIAALLAAATAFASTNMRDMFQDFKVKYNRKYSTFVEEEIRYSYFVDNMERAAAMQAQNPLAEFGANEFADFSRAEFKAYHDCDKQFAAESTRLENVTLVDVSEAQKLAAAGQAIDWRAKGAVTRVKQQGGCGSCWAFGATGSMEGQWFVAGNKLVELSEQELVSCDKTAGACAGGTVDGPMKWLVDNRKGEIFTEASYPYVSGTGSVPACNLAGKTVGARIIGWQYIVKNEASMAAWVYAYGPLAVSVASYGWSAYKGGIVTSCTNPQVDHAVLVVGFNDNYSPPYWIIKNSWGPAWGESGFIRIAMKSNQCKIATMPISAKVASAGPTPPPPAPTTTKAPTPAPTTTKAPTPAPSPSQPAFVQSDCGNNQCSTSCVNTTYPLGTCVKRSTTASAIAVCQSGMVALTEFPESVSCGGPWYLTVLPVNECLVRKDNPSRYFTNYCVGQGLDAPADGVAAAHSVLSGLDKYARPHGAAAGRV